MHYPISQKFIIPKDIYHDPFSNTQHRPIKFILMQKKKLSYPFFSRINLIIMYQIYIKIQILNKKLYIGLQNITFVSNL